MQERIETRRLTLRRFAAGDWPDLYEYLSQPETVRYEPYDPFDETQARAEAARRAGDEAFWAVCLRETGKVIGNVYLARGEFETWELGYVFNGRFRGRGYATEAARALVSAAFAQEGAHRVIAMCNPENTASWRLMERLGMRREAHEIRNIWFRRDEAGNPVRQDTYLYAVLCEEWGEVAPGGGAAV